MSMYDAQMMFHNPGVQPAGVPHVPDFDHGMAQQMHAYGQFPQQPAFPQQQMQQQQMPQQHMSQDFSNTKKRRLGENGQPEEGFEIDEYGDLPLVDSGPDGFKPTKLLKIKDAIEAMARDGRALSYEPSNNTYTVLDGKIFEEEFNALRATRNKKNEAAKDRPFSRMHRFYTLLQGEKWAGTGSIFTPKEGVMQSSVANSVAARTISPSTMSEASRPEHTPVLGMPVPNSPIEDNSDVRSNSTLGGGITTAENVSVSIVGPNGLETISLQHFLDVTGAGQLYHRSIAHQSGAPPRLSTSSSGLAGITLGGAPSAFGQGGSGILSGIGAGGELPLEFTQQQLQAPLEIGDIYKVVGGVWTADSKGDQGYFFKRKAGQRPMHNGAIVGIMKGELVTDDVYFRAGMEDDDEEEEEREEESRGLWMVVSDNNVKWKGEPIPTVEEEALGHWCCFLGQVPVFVDGKAKTGDHIGPKCDGSGMGTVVRPGKAQPVVGIALTDKAEAEPGVLKVLCFAGLNALSEGVSSPQLSELFDRMAQTEARLAAIEGKVRGVAGNVEDIELGVVGTRGEVDELAERVSLIERLQFWRRPHNKETTDDRDVTPAQVAVGIPLSGAGTAVQDNSIKGAIKRHPLYFGIFVGVIVALALTIGLVFALRQSPAEAQVVSSNGTVIVVSTGSGSDTED